MVKLNKIYTKTGDDGTTGLVGGDRVKKYTLRVEAYGKVDEANSMVGNARRHVIANYPHAMMPLMDLNAMLLRVQHDLFDLGADLATPIAPDDAPNKALRIIPQQVERLEKEIDAMNEGLQPLNSFVLPGGTAASSILHIARCVVRRAERVAAALAEQETINPEAIRYLNRLSDHLFVMARVANRHGEDDVLWQPGVNR